MAINAYFHVTATGAGTKSGNSWANAMDEPAFETHLEGAVVAGDVHFVMDGSYTLDSDIDSSARDGTTVSPIVIIGVKTGTTNEGAAVVYSDWSRVAGDRPFFDGVTFTFKVGDYYVIRNIDFTSADNIAVVQAGAYSVVENCKFEDTFAAGVASGLSMQGAYGVIVNNEMLSTNNRGLTANSNSRVVFNYIHDTGNQGIVVTHAAVYAFNILDTCAIGIDGGGFFGNTVLNNTFYETDVGVDETTGYSWVCINNIMEGNNTDGFKWTTQTDINFFWNNHGDDARCNDMWDLVDTTTVFQDYEVSTGDPKFTTPGSDFSLQSDSPNIDNGMSIILGV